MKVSFEVPLLVYCSECGGHRDFKGLGDAEMVRHLYETGWYIHTSPGGEFRALCPECFVAELRERFRTHDDERPAAIGVFRAKKIEIVDDEGKVLLMARAGPSGGEISVHNAEGTALVAMAASPEGGAVGVADGRGTMIWRAPCRNPQCIIQRA